MWLPICKINNVLFKKQLDFQWSLVLLKLIKASWLKTQYNSLNTSYLRDPSQLKKLLIKMDTLLIVFLFFF